ncbi:MAG TPA: hypothetical protein VGD71_27565 [Kribbella sp.]|jgi:hypothetical protein
MRDVLPDGFVPYREVSEPDYAEKAAATFVIEDFDIGMSLLSGLCPRCGVAIEIPLIDGVFRGDRAGRVDTAERAGGTRDVPIICTCTEVHPGRPDGQVGCGAYWIFDLPDGS